MKQTQKENIFNLIIQYLEKYSSTVQQLAYRGWLWENRQEKLLPGGQRGSGRWWGRRIVSNRRWRASCNFTQAWHWWHMHSQLWKFTTWRFIGRVTTITDIDIHLTLESLLLLSDCFRCTILVPIMGLFTFLMAKFMLYWKKFFVWLLSIPAHGRYSVGWKSPIYYPSWNTFESKSGCNWLLCWDNRCKFGHKVSLSIYIWKWN